MWKSYLNTGGNSGVASYNIDSNGIYVRFLNTGAVYFYSKTCMGDSNYNFMCDLAKSGSGLHSFIMRSVKNCGRKA